MKLCYQVATPDVAVAPSVTAFQGDLERSFDRLAELGYDGVEFMTLTPYELDWTKIDKLLSKTGLSVALVCTGEIYGQLGLSFTDPDADCRAEAIRRTKEVVDIAAHFGAHVNIGRVRGQYYHDVPREVSYALSVEALRELSAHAAPQKVNIAIESVTIMQTNFINTIAEAAKMADDVGCDNVKIMMDVFHMNIEEKDLFESIRKYASYNIHVHLADNNRRYPGQCGMDFEKVVQAFCDVGYDGAFCTEIYQIPDQEQAAQGAIQHLRPIFDKIYGKK